MKKIVFVILLALIGLALTIQGCSVLAAQSFIDDTIKDEIVNKALNWYTILQVALSIGITYAAPWLPFLNRVSSKALQGAIVAGLCGFIFYATNGDASGSVVAFLTVVNPYELIAKPLLGKTPSVPDPVEPLPDDEEIQ